MKRYKTLLVAAALDTTDATTLRHAACFARVAQTQRVYVAHIVPTFDLPREFSQQQPELVQSIDEEAEDRLKQVIAEQRSQFLPDTQINCVVREGSPPVEVVRLAAQKSADLICLGRGAGPDKSPLGSAAVKIVRKAPCSAFVVPVGVEPRYERILVPVDFADDYAREILDVAFAVATCTPGAEITILNVYSPIPGYHKLGQTYQQAADGMKPLAEWEWDKLASKVDYRGIPWKVRLELGEKVSKTILAVADEMDAQLIVMGSHGRTFPAAVLLGHVAESVGLRTTRPFLCVKKKGRSSLCCARWASSSGEFESSADRASWLKRKESGCSMFRVRIGTWEEGPPR